MKANSHKAKLLITKLSEAKLEFVVMNSVEILPLWFYPLPLKWQHSGSPELKGH